MAKFEYSAFDQSGKKVDGTVEANDKEAATSIVANQG